MYVCPVSVCVQGMPPSFPLLILSPSVLVCQYICIVAHRKGTLCTCSPVRTPIHILLGKRAVQTLKYWCLQIFHFLLRLHPPVDFLGIRTCFHITAELINWAIALCWLLHLVGLVLSLGEFTFQWAAHHCHFRLASLACQRLLSNTSGNWILQVVSEQLSQWSRGLIPDPTMPGPSQPLTGSEEGCLVPADKATGPHRPARWNQYYSWEMLLCPMWGFSIAEPTLLLFS